MRGQVKRQQAMFVAFDIEQRVPEDHPLRPIKRWCDKVLAQMSRDFNNAYGDTGNVSIPPESMIKALLLRALYSIPSERRLCEACEYNFLYRWFIDWPSEAKQPQSIFLSPSAPYPTPFCQQALEQQQLKDRQENINLLYVAVTRAKQFLYISGNKKPDGWFKLICDRFEIILEEHQQATVVEHHQGKSATPASPDKTKTKSIITDVRLQLPVKFEMPFVEIVPSRPDTHVADTEFYLQNTMASNATQTEAIQRGNMIHDMLFKQSIHPSLSIEQYVNNNQLNLPNKNVEENWLQAQQTISHFPQYFSTDRYQHAYGEVPVYFKHDNRLVHGIIDRLVVTDMEAIIIDYKTHSINPDSDPNLVQNHLTLLADQYRSQLMLYQQGVQLLYPKLNTRAFIIFTSVPTSLEIS